MSHMEFGEHVHVVDHPLVAHKLSIMRDKNTSVKDFRELVSEIGMYITYEATRDLPLTTKMVETPLCTAELPTLAGKKIAVRDEETLVPHTYFCKLPKDIADREVMVVDPMLATGGSADAALAELKKRGCSNIKLMVLVAAPEGIRMLREKHPDVDIYCGAVDDHLNEHGYIVPGLGDAGDRIFGTK